MKRAVVNYITLNAWHPHGQARLAKSLRRVKFDGDIVLFNPSNLQSPSHHTTPYAFKFYALKELQKRKYDLVLWVDASFWAIRSVRDLFAFIEKKKIVIQACEFSLGQYSSDDSLKRLDVTRNDAFTMLMYSGGLVGLDLRDNKAKAFLNTMFEFAKEGFCFRGSWTNRKQEVSKNKRVKGHRHDMVVGTVLARRMDVEIQRNNNLFSYYGWYTMYRKEKNLDNKIYFVCEGGRREI